MNNYEWIKNMSLSFMARFWFDRYADHGGCKWCPALKGYDNNHKPICDGKCYENMTEWLKQEYTGDIL